MRALFLLLLLLPFAASAADAPAGQVPIGMGQVLRGGFVQTSQRQISNAPMQSTGHFTLAPSHGLIWSIEQPFPTATIVTPQKSVQMLGGMAIKLPIKNLRHLYDMIGGALTRDWTGLEADYSITFSNRGDHWQAVLTPRPNGKTLTYSAITISGAHFVENIVMVRGDGSNDTLTFSNESLSPEPLAPAEAQAFSQVGP